MPPSVDLSFTPNQPVGIHFKWENAAYKVVGFTDDSPAEKQNKIEKGCVLLMLNSISLHNVPQKVVNKMMVGCAAEDRVLSFTAPKVKAKEKKLPTKPVQPAEKPPQLKRRRSSSDDISTPARRMRIIYEFAKPLVLRYREKGVQAAMEKMRQNVAAEVIQRNIRGFLGRKFFTAVMKIRKFKAAQNIQKEIRRILAISRAEKLRLLERERIEKNAATVVNSVARMKLAVLLANRLRAAQNRRRSMIESDAAAKLQSIVRKRPHERLFKVALASSRTIQKHLRAKIARTFVENLRRKMLSATLIQKHSRRISAIEESRKRRRAVVVLQGMAKIWQAKRMRKDLKEEIMIEAERDDDNFDKATPQKPQVLPPPEPSLSPKESMASPANTVQSPESTTATEQSADPLSPKELTFQLRFSPESGTCLQKGELFGQEIMSPTADSPMKPKSPETPMEEKFRRERYKKEVEAREKMAVMVQSRWRGGDGRKFVGAMRMIAAAISRAKNIQRCRLVVKAILKKRNEAALVVQMKVRMVLATERVAKLRVERLEYCVEMMEAEYSITELAKAERGAWGNWGLPGDEDIGLKDPSKNITAKIAQTQNMWLRTMPESSRYCEGCDIFRECVDDVEAGENYGKVGVAMLSMDFN